MNEQAYELEKSSVIEMAAEIVSAYVSCNHVQASELPALIASVHAALSGLGSGASAELVGPEKPTPAQIKKSVTPDAITSFEDGKPYKTMRRHLTIRGLTPEAYRAKWGLPADYPMTSAGYSAARSALAHAAGLGKQRRKAAPKVAAAAETVSEAPKTSGRKPKAVEAPVAAPKARGRKKIAETA